MGKANGRERRKNGGSSITWEEVSRKRVGGWPGTVEGLCIREIKDCSVRRDCVTQEPKDCTGETPIGLK